MINYIVLIVALMLSSVSAYYSILGLTTLFSAAFWPVVIMGTVLEIAKVVTASWLYRNWRYTPILLKGYLTTAVLVLCFITSLGVFGFLSKAHIDQTVNLNTGVADQIKIITSKIDFENQKVDDLNKQINQIDSAISKMNERGQASNSLRAATQQRRTRDSLIKRKEEHVKNISTLTTERINLQSQIRKLEAEVGPIKYIAELVYQDKEKVDLEKAVRWIILLIIAVFDPLAILLLIAANVGMRKKHLIKFEEDTNIKIDPNSIVHID